jgi:hypothetical protein
VQTMVDSATKIRWVLPQNTLARAVKLHVVVRNPAPLATVEWGDTSNTAHILVPFSFSTELANSGLVNERAARGR